MKIFGIAGWSGSGKTTLMVRLLPELNALGLRVSTMKHAHHAFDVDQPGKDSHSHRMAGASEVLITSANRWALMHENRGEPEPSIEELVRHMTPVDLLLIEGFKRSPHPKLEVFRRATGKPLLALEDSSVVAVACDGPVPEVTVPVLDLNQPAEIARFLMTHCSMGSRDNAAGTGS
ncbi:molybdopterin-guanine dinucleotide biosynthesis protein B [Skermanella mucosa]|uniref:molybdopterin-guanine dinucleotide biosynthesis protein B n=1 Tax=Skermanella mucosa TaxID=1789672 RepID=UPI00192B1909|nr:molybdopterin-guanine dinucleotide biosynthesis protein B [Skermanella mucosa]UEM22648.1 molybdopterin-guanine dinucleotide biosynthesis protein B [Skermanella mucosa]